MGESTAHVMDVRCQFDNSAEFEPQIRQLVDTIGLNAIAWQTERILINSPGYAPATAVLLAELYGRMGLLPIADSHSAEPKFGRTI